MLTIVSRSDRARSRRAHRVERGAVLDEPLLLAVPPDEVRDVVHVRVAAGRDRREADGRQRREGRDGAAVLAGSARSASAGARRSHGRLEACGVRPSITTRISFLRPGLSPREDAEARVAARPRGARERARRAAAARAPRGSRAPARRRARRATTAAASDEQRACPPRVPPRRERAGDEPAGAERAERAADAAGDRLVPASSAEADRRRRPRPRASASSATARGRRRAGRRAGRRPRPRARRETDRVPGSHCPASLDAGVCATAFAGTSLRLRQRRTKTKENLSQTSAPCSSSSLARAPARRGGWRACSPTSPARSATGCA